MTIKTSIDLNFCVPGQKVRLRGGGIADYLGLIENNISLVYLHQLSSGKYVSNGCYWSDQRTDELDVVEIFPLKSSMNIDLNICVPGQKVKLSDGTIATYKGKLEENEIYTHEIGGHSYTRRGTFWDEDGRTSPKDVAEILPIEEDPIEQTPLESTMNIDLNTCVPGQKVRLRNGDIGQYDGQYDNPITGLTSYTHTIDGYAYMNDGSYWKDGRESDLDVVEILPLEYDYKINTEEPAKLTPELTHSITDQINVTNPDHVSIIPHEHGVTICIKKGLTTISWRHYNS